MRELTMRPGCGAELNNPKYNVGQLIIAVKLQSPAQPSWEPRQAALWAAVRRRHFGISILSLNALWRASLQCFPVYPGIWPTVHTADSKLRS